MLLIFILIHYYLIAKWLTISSCCVVFVFQSLLRSPEVISFLQQQQRLLTTQNRAQTQHNYWRLKMFYSSCRRFNADTFNDIFTTAVFYTHVRTMSICDLQPSLMVWRLSTLHSENWDIWQGPDRFEVLLSSSSSLRSWNEIAAKSNIYKQSSWITTLFGHM